MRNHSEASIDPAGEETLLSFSKATAFNKWMCEQIIPRAKGHILEIGSGIGNISEILLQNNLKVTLSDLNPAYCRLLKSKFEHFDTCNGVISIDISDESFEEKYEGLLAKFDTIIALNVIEHIEDDGLAFANCKKLLNPGGQIIILVPAFNFLYNSFDRELGHYRRYTIKSLNEKMKQSGFSIYHRQYFNMPAILGWYFSGSVFKLKLIPENQLHFYNSLVPFFRIIDKLFQRIMGISVIMVGAKK
jgi:SAM-dependent methyltransferase